MQSAEAQAQRILATAQLEAASIAQHAAANARSEAELAMRAAIGAYTETLLNRVMSSSFNAAQKLMEESFPQCLATLLVKGASQVGTNQIDADLPTDHWELFTLHEEQIRERIGAHEITLRHVQGTLASRGGCVVYSVDRRRVCTATFEERFRRLEEFIRQELATRLEHA